MDWTAAACAGKPEELFFPGRGDHLLVREARNICRGCPIRDADAIRARAQDPAA